MKSILLHAFAFASVYLSTCSAKAQGVGTIETPYNRSMYKASHNSYDRHEALADQVDNYNVWQIELDVYDYNGHLYVNHACTSPFSEASTLPDLLTALVADSKTYKSKFTMIYLDMKGNGNESCYIGWGSTLQDRLRTCSSKSFPLRRSTAPGNFRPTARNGRPSRNWCVGAVTGASSLIGTVRTRRLRTTSSSLPPPATRLRRTSPQTLCWSIRMEGATSHRLIRRLPYGTADGSIEPILAGHAQRTVY